MDTVWDPIVSVPDRCPLSHPVNYVYHKIILTENESYLDLVAGQILFVTINNVY